MDRPSPGTPGRQWPVISALGVVMIFTWGSTFYLMAVLAAPIAADTGWSLGAITGALSAGLLVAGLASPAIGRGIARFGGRPVLAAGCLLIAAGQGVIALAPQLWVFWAGWLVLGLGMGAALYDAAFATLGRLFGLGARRAITHLTLWGGFASTVCWPLSTVMLEAWGWRGVALGYGAIHLCVTLPLVLWLVPAAPVRPARLPGDPAPVVGLSRGERRAFVLMAGLLVLNGLIVVNVSTWLFVFLQAQGMTLASAVALGALIGPAQVGARVIEMAAGGRHHPIWTLAAAMAAIAAGLALLLLDLGVAGAALIVYGGGNGLFSIARGALPLSVFGAERYPVVMGRLARPALMAQAAAPLLGAWMIGLAGAQAMLSLIAGLAAVNLLVMGLLWAALPRR